MALSMNTPRSVLEISGLTVAIARAAGFAKKLIHHNLRQVFDFVDRLWVFRQGRIIADLETRHTHPEQIVGLITGAIDPARLVREPVATP
jgi:ABC-type sugar transport system ATPase subunit